MWPSGADDADSAGASVGLEGELRFELDSPACISSGDRASVRLLQRGVWVGKIRMIQHIIGVDPHLEVRYITQNL